MSLTLGFRLPAPYSCNGCKLTTSLATFLATLLVVQALTMRQVPYPQIVLLGDSLLQFSVDLQDGFSFQAALQTRMIRPALHPTFTGLMLTSSQATFGDSMLLTAAFRAGPRPIL